HGLRADALPMPGEDPELARQRADAWNDYYQPQRPAAQHVVNECARATLQADRVARFQAAAVVWQVKEARRTWIERRGKEVSQQVERLRNDPDAARWYPRPPDVVGSSSVGKNCNGRFRFAAI